MKIRLAREDDAQSLLEIYAPYVKETAITFEYEIPSIKEFAERISETLKNYPYLVCEIDKKIVGYAYASRFKNRKAYDWAVETSIYVEKSFRRSGIGSVLLKNLENLLLKQNILNANACIAQTDSEDLHLTNASIFFHQKNGYQMVGKFNQCAYKFDRWYNMVWMEKLLAPHKTPQADFIPFSELCDNTPIVF